jgi:hypothetical protein
VRLPFVRLESVPFPLRRETVDFHLGALASAQAASFENVRDRDVSGIRRRVRGGVAASGRGESSIPNTSTARASDGRRDAQAAGEACGSRSVTQSIE